MPVPTWSVLESLATSSSSTRGSQSTTRRVETVPSETKRQLSSWRSSIPSSSESLACEMKEMSKMKLFGKQSTQISRNVFVFLPLLSFELNKWAWKIRFSHWGRLLYLPRDQCLMAVTLFTSNMTTIVFITRIERKNPKYSKIQRLRRWECF